MKEIPVLFFVIVGAGGALANLTSPLIFIIAAAVIFSTATLATIQNDKATSWNKFSITLPVSKQQIVIEKYVVYALLVIFGILVGSVISIPIAIGTKTFQMDSYLSTVFIGLALALISGSFSIPCSCALPIYCSFGNCFIHCFRFHRKKDDIPSRSKKLRVKLASHRLFVRKGDFNG